MRRVSGRQRMAVNLPRDAGNGDRCCCCCCAGHLLCCQGNPLGGPLHVHNTGCAVVTPHILVWLVPYTGALQTCIAGAPAGQHTKGCLVHAAAPLAHQRAHRHGPPPGHTAHTCSTRAAGGWLTRRALFKATSCCLGCRWEGGAAVGVPATNALGLLPQRLGNMLLLSWLRLLVSFMAPLPVQQ